jgi:hypothetical protein
MNFAHANNGEKPDPVGNTYIILRSILKKKNVRQAFSQKVFRTACCWPAAAESAKCIVALVGIKKWSFFGLNCDKTVFGLKASRSRYKKG